MKNKNLVLLFLLLMVEGGLLSAAAQSKSSVYKPWSHGQLKGFVIYASAPLSIPSNSCSREECAVSKIIGI